MRTPDYYEELVEVQMMEGYVDRALVWALMLVGSELRYIKDSLVKIEKPIYILSQSPPVDYSEMDR